MNIVFLDGTFHFENEAFIPVNDRGFLFGDGVFTTIRVIEGQPECMEMHLERIQSHCRALNIVPPAIASNLIMELIKQNGAENGQWRLKIIVTGGGGSGDGSE